MRLSAVPRSAPAERRVGGRARQGKTTAGVMLFLGAAVGFVLAARPAGAPRRLDVARHVAPTIREIRERCRWDCDDVVPYVLVGADPSRLEREWPVLDAELIALENRVDAAAVSAVDIEAQRALDECLAAIEQED